MLDTTFVEEEMQAARNHAQFLGVLAQFDQTLDYLSTYANGPACRYDTATGANTKCVLGRDFAPFFFSFAIYSKKTDSDKFEYWFNGGLIFQGPSIPADGSAPSFTVSMNPSEVGWFVHT